MTVDLMSIRRPANPLIMHCPFCGKPITEARRLPYPATLIAHLAPVYRCRCGKHLGAPLTKEKPKP